MANSTFIQNQAFHQLFMAILQENGYYTNLRHFMTIRHISLPDMARMLNNEYDKAPDGMSVYYYMDSLEDAFPQMDLNEIRDVDDMVDFVYEHQLWKE